MHGAFIWADLSTFRLDKTRRFYGDVMGWQFDGDVAFTDAPVASIYTMPEKFQKIGMPSFWMSYIAVSEAAHAVRQAKALGGKVELGPVAYEQGEIALIRDPLGAGFTIYSGPPFPPSATGPAARAGHGLFVSDMAAIKPFYEALFGWRFGVPEMGVSAVSKDGETLFHCHEIPDPALRGKEEYWGVFFAAPDAGVKGRVGAAGGKVVASMVLPEGPALLAHDPDGGHFFVTDQGIATPTSGSQTKSAGGTWLWVAFAIVGALTLRYWGP
ncbi:MAG: VOC family protein [Pseudomonadota bacterium]